MFFLSSNLPLFAWLTPLSTMFQLYRGVEKTSGRDVQYHNPMSFFNECN